MFRILGSRMTPLLGSVPSPASSPRVRTFVHGPVLHNLLRIPVCDILLKGARFQRPSMCLQDHFVAFDKMLHWVSPVRPEQENCKKAKDKKSEYKDRRFPEGMWQMEEFAITPAENIYKPAKEIAASSAKNIYKIVKERGPALMLHYGIGDGYSEHHVVIVCMVFEIDGGPHAVLLDTNDLAKNPAADKARRMLPPGYGLHQLSSKESFFRVVDLGDLAERGQTAFDEIKKGRHWEAVYGGEQYYPLEPPALWVADTDRVDTSLLLKLTPEESLRQFAILMRSCRDQIEGAPK